MTTNKPDEKTITVNFAHTTENQTVTVVKAFTEEISSSDIMNVVATAIANGATILEEGQVAHFDGTTGKTTVVERCQGCPHPQHRGACTKRSGGTGYACGCTVQMD